MDLGKRGWRPDSNLSAAVGKAGMWTPDYLCPWCGTRNHRRWVGDHVVPLALSAGSPIVPAGYGCNLSRRGVRASTSQMERLFRPAVEIGTHTGEEIRAFCAAWARARYGSPEFLDLAIGDSGPYYNIKRRAMLEKKVPCKVGQRKADQAYLRFDYTAAELEAMRERHRRKTIARLAHSVR